MDRHQFSYWITIRPAITAVPDRFKYFHHKVTESLRLHLCLWPDGPFEISRDDAAMTISGCVPESEGTVECYESLEDDIAAVAAECPSATIELLCIDEEDRSCQTLYQFADGKKQLERHARIVPPDRMYDETTVNDIMKWLTLTGNKDIADAVACNFSER